MTKKDLEAEGLVVAADHCAFLMREGYSSRQALQAIGVTQPKKAGWGVVLAHVARRWIVMQQRTMA
jgi:hypothetical protein